MKTIVAGKEECIRRAAGELLELVKAKSDAALVSSAERDELWVLEAFVQEAKAQGVCLDRLRIFAACECEAPARDNKLSVRARLLACLTAGGIREENLFAPGADCEAYDRLIEDAGGIDLALLGLGLNARVAFNEPATPYDSHTHTQKLTRPTRETLSALFGGVDKTPERGVTLGFQNLCAARRILVIALGEEKNKAVYRMLYGRNDSIYPAAFLQLPLQVTLYADEEAARGI